MRWQLMGSSEVVNSCEVARVKLAALLDCGPHTDDDSAAIPANTTCTKQREPSTAPYWKWVCRVSSFPCGRRPSFPHRRI